MSAYNTESGFDPQILGDQVQQTQIAIVGVGGAGTQVVDRLQLGAYSAVKLIAANTDAQALGTSVAQEKLLLGRKLTRGLGTGGDFDRGREAAEQEVGAIERSLHGMDLVFVVASLGGGTGSGAAPVFADIARKLGAMVIAFVTYPFSFEGQRRIEVADAALSKLRSQCQAVIPLPNDLLVQGDDEAQNILSAFEQGDQWMESGVRAICGIVLKTGLVNHDFASLQRVLDGIGNKTLFGVGLGDGEGAVDQALAALKQCPLLHAPEGAHRAERLIVSITGGTDLGMSDVHRIANTVNEMFSSKDETLLGATIDEDQKQRIEICVLGVSDMGHRGVLKERKEIRIAGEPEPLELIEMAEPKSKRNPLDPGAKPDGKGPRVHTSKLAKKQAADSREQEEFSFFSEGEQRGFFDKTDRNLFDGADLDVPTYLRRGIKIYQC
ncbi:MAG: cell division protein FtsZ [Verrucomicrobiota bacterium]